MLPYIALFEYIHKQIEHVIEKNIINNDVYEEYKNIVRSPQLADQVFMEIMNNYFYEVGLKNAKLIRLKEPEQYIGVKVRATKDTLIVTEVIDDIRFVVGDEILRLSGDSIDYCRKRYHRILGDEPYHREEWERILTYQNDVTIQRGNLQDRIELKLYPVNQRSFIDVYEKDGVPILNIVGNITFEQAVDGLYRLSHFQTTTQKVIFDFRKARFDQLSIAEFLLPYFFEIGIHSEVDTTDTEILLDNERQNVLFKQKLERLNKRTNDMNEQAFYQNLLDQPIGNWRFFEDNKIEFIGLSRFESIDVIIDKDTEQGAEWLVQNISESQIVNIIGRPTKGYLNFFESVDEIIDQRFLFTFPVANQNTNQCDDIVYPDLLLEWTKRHVMIDLDIKFACDNSS